MSETKEIKFPSFRKMPAAGIYFKFFNQWKYAAVRVSKGEQGVYYSYMQTESTNQSSNFLLHDMDMQEATEQEYLDKLKDYAAYGKQIFQALNK